MKKEKVMLHELTRPAVYLDEAGIELRSAKKSHPIVAIALGAACATLDKAAQKEGATGAASKLRMKLRDKFAAWCWQARMREQSGAGQKRPLWIGGSPAPIDELIADAVMELNRRGFPTTSSCQGGSEKGHDKCANIAIKSGQSFPRELLTLLEARGVRFRKWHASDGGEWLSAESPADNESLRKALGEWAASSMQWKV